MTTSRFQRVYRATYTQAIIIGTLSFIQPGIWSAISNLGAGGLQTVSTSNTANSVLFAVMFVFSPIFSILINKIGIKPIVSVGCVGYTLWSAGLYLNSKDGTQWLIMFGAAVCGISAAAFWTAEGTVAILYPDDNSRGMFIGTWQLINKVGSLISGAITLALNHNSSHAGSVSLNTYVVLLSIQCIGLPISFLLSPPEKLIRADGKKLKRIQTDESWKERVASFTRILLKKEVMCLIPLFLSNIWFNAWQSNYMTHHFSVRVRALNSLLSAFIPGATDIIAGYFLDLKSIKKSTKVRISWLVTVIFMFGFFIYSIIIQHEFDVNPEKGIDWSGNPRYARTFVPFQVFKISGELIFNWAIWILGEYHFKPSEISAVSGILRSFESLGKCMAFVVGTVNSQDMVSLAVSFGIFGLSIPSVTYSVLQVDDLEDRKKFDTSDEDEKVDESQEEFKEEDDQLAKRNFVEKVDSL